MRRRLAGGRVLLVTLDRDSSRPLYEQIHHQLRASIEAGRLPRGTVLPSTRALATDLGVARSTVVQAYAHLRAEGLLSPRAGSSTRVVGKVPQLRVKRAGRQPRPRAQARVRQVSLRSRSVLEIQQQSRLPIHANELPRAFVTGQPALDVFPSDIWGRLVARRWRRTSARALGYGDPQGLPELRDAVSSYLVGARGLHCSPSQVIIVQGAQQALDIVARVTLDPGDRAWIEDPGYTGARLALAAAGATLVPVPVDDHGLDVADARRRAESARLAFVTPARQMPLGGLMSLERRQALLAWASEDDRRWVLEDDYDSEFRYVSQPVAALQALDRAESVIHVGTWTKLLYPSLRLGYMVVPAPLVDACVAMRVASDFASPYLEQAVMTDFITDGHLDRHIRRLRATYRERLAHVKAAVASELRGVATLQPVDAGRAVVLWLAPGLTERAATAAAEAVGVTVTPLSAFCLKPYPRAGLVLGYSGLRAADVREGMARLGAALARGLER